ncbi:hypothetical protein PIB30_070112, partial [Stylosanthes scabra]|nr:hypothetical protein [Stylosanthes scabra]
KARAETNSVLLIENAALAQFCFKPVTLTEMAVLVYFSQFLYKRNWLYKKGQATCFESHSSLLHKPPVQTASFDGFCLRTLSTAKSSLTMKNRRYKYAKIEGNRAKTLSTA